MLIKTEKTNIYEETEQLFDTIKQEEKTAYSTYIEIQLEGRDFGLSRKDHNRICNEKLLAQIERFESDGRQFHSKISNRWIW